MVADRTLHLDGDVGLDHEFVAGPYADASAAFATTLLQRFMFTGWWARPVVAGHTGLRCNAATVVRRARFARSGSWTWGTAVNPRPRKAGSFDAACALADRELSAAGWRLL